MLKLTAHGHKNVRLTHEKTLEITAETEISTRATCIAGLGANWHLAPFKSLTGSVHIQLEAGGHTATLIGDVNPNFNSTTNMVFRRSDAADERTFLVNTTLQASQLPKEMVTALQNPQTTLTITFTEAEAPPTGLQRQSAPYHGAALYLVGVPFGDDSELSPRALRTLKQANIIAAEDTRKANRLFAEHDIHPQKVLAHHTHNEHEGAQGLVNLLQKGQTVAYISDAGMPTISDPGYLLAKAAIKANFAVVPVGAGSAVVAALAASGLPADRFSFHGFLPRTPGARQAKLAQIAPHPETQVFYEAPHRLPEMLADVHATLGNRQAVLARELTKTHEEILRGPLEALVQHVQHTPPRGAFVLVVNGAEKGQMVANSPQLNKQIEEMLKAGVSVKQVRDDLAKQHNLPKRQVYQLALEISKKYK